MSKNTKYGEGMKRKEDALMAREGKGGTGRGLGILGGVPAKKRRLGREVG